MKIFLKVAAGLCVIAVLAAAGLFGTEYLISGQASSGGRGSEAQPTRVGVSSPEFRTIDDDVTVVGTIRPVRAVQLVPSSAGRVTEVAVAPGQDVAAGDLVVQLDDRAERAALADAEATVNETRQELRRIEELADNNAAAEARLEEARAAFSRAEAAAQSARADLDDRAITAPFGGTLGLIDVEPGTYLDASTPVTRLSDLSVVEVSASVPERYFDRVVPGQIVEVTTPAYPETRFEGRVTVRAPEIDLASRAFDIRAEIDNPDRRLVGGMFADARLVFDSYEGLAIPDDAIISEGLTTFVYTVSEGAAQRTEISVGASLDAMTEVRDGLSETARVVVAGWDRLSDGAPVEVAEDVAEEGLE